MNPSRRSFLIGGAVVIAAPAIVHIESLMPVRGIIMDPSHIHFATPAEALNFNMMAHMRSALLPGLFDTRQASPRLFSEMLRAR